MFKANVKQLHLIQVNRGPYIHFCPLQCYQTPLTKAAILPGEPEHRVTGQPLPRLAYFHLFNFGVLERLVIDSLKLNTLKPKTSRQY